MQLYVTKDGLAFGGAGATVALILIVLWTPSAQAQSTVSICDRTAAVRDEILHLTGASDCSTVSGDELAAITILELDNAGIDSLKSGDFAGLTELTELLLYGNRLVMLPSDVFSGLSSLTSLQLSYNNLESLAANVFSVVPSLVNLNVSHSALTSLPASVFSGLSNLKYLFLGANDIAALPAGVFSDLRSLDILFLDGNNFTTLPPGVFSDLASLRWLTLEGGALTTLPEDAFSGLSSLTTADLANNDLTTLPSNVFAGAPGLVDLLLSGNNLGGLPDGVFLGLSSLRTLWLQGNNLDPMPVEVSLRLIGGGMVKATVSSGAPFPIEVPLTVTNGTVDGDSVIVIPTGSVESAAITVIPDPGADGAVTADVGTLPELPVTSDYYSYWGETHPAHHGYELERSADLPLTVHEVRTPSVVSLVLSPASIAEDGGVSTITATVSPAAQTAFTVTVSAAAVSPGVAEDFTLSGNTLSVAVGATTSTGTVTITAVNDNVDAADKAVTVSGTIETEDAGVANPENRTLAIEDDDIASTGVALAVHPDEVNEGAGDTRVTVTGTLNAAARTEATEITVSVGSTNGTGGATSGTDFDEVDALTLTIPANSLEGATSFTLSPTDDTEVEDDEMASVTGTAAGLSVAGTDLTITDNDTLPPLTARFLSVPDSHDGSEPITFELSFSEEVKLRYKQVRDSVLEVSGGTVTRAKRVVKGSNKRWRIKVDSLSNQDVTILLPSDRACGTSGAVCTSDGRALADSVAAVVEGPSSQSEATGTVPLVTPEAAAAVLFGEKQLGEDQLFALDSLGNRNGRYDLGDLLSWMARCRRGEPICQGESSPAPDSIPGSGAPLPARRESGRNRHRWGAGSDRNRRSIRRSRSGRRRHGFGLLTLMVSAWACSDGGRLAQPQIEQTDPGFLTVELTTAPGARDIGVLLMLEGPTLDSLRAPGLDFVESGAASPKQVVVSGPLVTGPILEFWVPDRRLRTQQYRVRVLEIAGETYALSNPSKYLVKIGRAPGQAARLH